jgi:hypothetical protein
MVASEGRGGKALLDYSRFYHLRFTRLWPNAQSKNTEVANEPYYLPVDNEIGLFEAAHAAKLPVILKGPTGCGKTALSSTWRGGLSGP